MKSAIRNLLFLSVIFFSLACVSFVFGNNYGSRKGASGLDLSVCGVRRLAPWEQPECLLFSIIGISIFGLVANWRRSQPVYDKRLSILPRRNE